MSVNARRIPGLVASVLAGTVEDAFRAIDSAAEAGADTIELRLDASGCSEPGPLIASARSHDLKTIAACRRREDGGTYAGSEENRIDLLMSAVRARTDWIDLEAGSEPLRRLGSRLAAESSSDSEDPGLIVSHHDLTETPPGLPSLADRLAATEGARTIKLVTTARELEDNLAMRDLLKGWSSGRSRLPLIAFAMGPKGIPSRLLALAWGSAGSYFAADPARPAAEGQISIREAGRVFGVRDIGSRTRLLGITGRALSQSLSPLLHNAGLRECGYDARYLPFEADSFEEMISFAREMRLLGFSVTAPHKIAAARNLASTGSLDPLARDIGAVNTVVRIGERLRGFNTDAEGGVIALRRRATLRGARALVLGAGGAARALAFGLSREGVEVAVHNRTHSRAAELAREVSGLAVERDGLARLPYDFLVNATSAGFDEADGMPLPENLIRGRVVFDLVYRKDGTPTRLLRAAARAGVETIGGIEMLLEQAMLQFTLWFGPEGGTALAGRARRAMCRCLVDEGLLA